MLLWVAMLQRERLYLIWSFALRVKIVTKREMHWRAIFKPLWLANNLRRPSRCSVSSPTKSLLKTQRSPSYPKPLRHTASSFHHHSAPFCLPDGLLANRALWVLGALLAARQVSQTWRTRIDGRGFAHWIPSSASGIYIQCYI